ncbi:MAG: large subunit ribosomal protein L3 [Lysobacterales bacterium]|jgi:large subunit ribosomal protein L3
MVNGLIGRKLAMTQIFDKDGNFIPVTLVETGPCTVLEIKDNKVTLGFEDAKESRIGKPQLGFFKKIGVSPKRVVKEFTYDEAALTWLKEQAAKAQAEEIEEDKTEKSTEENTEETKEEELSKDVKEAEFGVGTEITANLFKPGDYINISGISIGKGFSGGMKRWGWKGGPATHGSRHHREPGSIGQCAYPGEVWKGTHLPGRMGGKRATNQGLRVMDIDLEKNLLIVKGSVPGS